MRNRMLKAALVYAVAVGVFQIAIAAPDSEDYANYALRNESSDYEITADEKEAAVPTTTTDQNIEDEEGDEILTKEEESSFSSTTTKPPKRKPKQRLSNGGDKRRNRKNAVCELPPDIEGLVTPILETDTQPVGTVVNYQCNFGHVSRSSSSLLSTCRIHESTGETEWTHPDTTCIPRSCGDPGYVINARRVGNLFTFPNKVEFECHEGYKLRGLKARYCQAGGEWSGRLPSCEPIYCSAPSDPVDGRAVYSSLDYGTELEYECNKGFMLQNYQPRICTQDGTWSNNEPECKEARCKIPEAPVDGSVKLIGEPKVGSLAVYSCKDDTNLFGPSTSKCLISGEWTFDPPKCLHFCRISVIQDGELGRYETKQIGRYRPRKEFVAFQEGESIKHDENVTIRCKDGFSPVNGTSGTTDEVLCNNGTWSKLLQCQSQSCNGDPPPIENGEPVVPSRRHGDTIWYKCNEYSEKAKSGRVECKYGNWKGPTPVCVDTRCHMNQLSFSGLVKPEGDFLENGKEFDIHCERAYTKSSWRRKISCSKGQWSISSNPCTIKTCQNQPPALPNGKSKAFTREHGSSVNYECNEDYLMVGISTVQCEFGEWEGKPPSCEKSSEYLIGTLATNFERKNEEKESLTPTPSSFQFQEECYCTYDYRQDLLAAYIGNRKLEGEAKIKKGETIAFDCLYSGTTLVWPNGLRFRDRIYLTCRTCQVWHMLDLPHCEPNQSGDSFMAYNRQEMKFLRGGMLEVSKYGNVTLQCNNPWGQPGWSVGNRKGISFYQYTAAATQATGIYAAFLVVRQLNNEHSGRYECHYTDPYKTRYRHTIVDLEVAEPEVQCPELQTLTIRGNFIIQYDNERKVNSKALYRCTDNSKELVGTHERTCLETGKWSGSFPACEDAPCPLLNERNVFVINYTNKRKVKSAALYYCKHNEQRLIGSGNRTCLHTQQWSGSEPMCEDITCLEFPTYNGLSVSYSNGRKVHSIATFHCSNPRTLVGSESSKCQYNATWTYPKPSCELLEIRCPKLEGKEIFTIKYSNNRRINTTAQFFCKAPDQKVSGCNFMTCQPNGEWSGDYPTCVDLITCEKFPNSQHLDVSYSDDLRVGSMASFLCSSPTFKLVGSPSAICRNDGTWSTSIPHCQVPNCSIDDLMMAIPEGVVPDMSDVTSEFVTPGSEMRLLCEDDLILTGDSKVTCSQGKWKHGDIQCVPGCRLNNDDSTLLLIEPVKEYYRFGEFILLSCSPGYKLTSDVERVMCLGRTWSDSIPTCAEWKETSPSGIRETTKHFP